MKNRVYKRVRETTRNGMIYREDEDDEPEEDDRELFEALSDEELEEDERDAKRKIRD
jgi:hypothetical protein